MSVRHTLRDLVESKQGLVVPGAFDGVSARLVERAGFPAVYMTGYGTSASRLGLPDLGYAGLAEMADHARNLAAAVTIPLIADADTGYGNAPGARTVRAYGQPGGRASSRIRCAKALWAPEWPSDRSARSSPVRSGRPWTPSD
jgi:2-methylisocitrate lyase-like PEP mutase family enzyme